MAGLATALAVAAAGVGGAQAESAVRDLPAGQLAGQRVVTGFQGHRPPRDLLRGIRAAKVAGVLLFSHNVRSRTQVARMVRRLQSVRRPRPLDEPLLVMVDQEGGPVRRIPGPPERSVADVARPHSAMERERRAYGRRPRKVARLAAAFAAGLHRTGLLATGKHFPGFGAARANTDNARVTIGTSRKRLRSVDARPYRALFRRGVRLVMLSTAVYPALHPGVPAAFSRRGQVRRPRAEATVRRVLAVRRAVR